MNEAEAVSDLAATSEELAQRAKADLEMLTTELTRAQQQYDHWRRQKKYLEKAIEGLRGILGDGEYA